MPSTAPGPADGRDAAPRRRTLRGMSAEEGAGAATDAFVAHRNLLFTVAYEMLGSAADAEDVLQETWLRWADIDRTAVRDVRAYLVRITTRLSLNRLRTVGRQRETYVGPWLPEPLLPARTWRRAGRGWRCPRRTPGGCWPPSTRRWRPATCSGCST